jgi:DNA-binding MarR family transcriptional regulator
MKDKTKMESNAVQPEQEERMIGAMLRIPFQATVSRVYEGLARAGYTDLRPAHFTVFQHLPPQGMRLTELAEKAQITKQTMGYLIDYMEKFGYVRKEVDPGDGRANLILWTEQGKAMGTEARRILRLLEEEWAAYIGEGRFQQLRKTLQDLISYLGK